MPDTDLVVDVPLAADLAPQEETSRPAEAVVDTGAGTVDEPVENLKKQLAELKSRDATRDAEIQRANAATEAARAETARLAEETAKVRTELTESNVSAIESAIAAAQAEAETFAREQEQALSTGEFAKAADLGRKAARAEARVVRLEEGKADVEARRAEKPKPATADQHTSTQADPFESAISNATPRAKQWLRAHPQYVTDASLVDKATKAHYAALGDGHPVDSDAYFDFVERRLGLKDAPKQDEPKPEQRTRAMPTAPVTRDTTPTGGQLSPTQVRLSPAEQARASDGTIVWHVDDPKLGAKKGQPIGIKEYARRKALMTQEGRYASNYTDQ